MTSSRTGTAFLFVMLTAPNAIFEVFDLGTVVPADTGVPRVASSPSQLPRPTTGVLSAWIDAQSEATRVATDDAVSNAH
ncbi:MAG: hypothetical protein KIT14_22310 [bacterium]|nr:hypothetical protein [bacterium]